MYISVVVADSHAHAKAMILWAKLDPSVWMPARYGDMIKHFYKDAIIIRPASGLTAAHLAWLEVEMMPRVSGRRTPFPNCWFPAREVEEADPLGFASMWTQ